jgi:hypothetical protein
VFPYEEGTLLEYVYVAHFWKEEIERTLKRVRELDARGRRDLNRFWLYFSIGTMAKVRINELVCQLESTIRQYGTRYSDKKREISSGVGFDETTFAGHVTFKSGTTLDDVIDMHLGLKDRLEIADFSAHSIRFGIATKTPTIQQTAGLVTMRSHPKECVVEISSESVANEVALPSSLYIPGIPNLPKEKWRFRISNDFLQLVSTVGTERGQFKIGWNSEDRRSLAQIGVMLDLLRMVSTGRLHFRVRIGGAPVFAGTASTEGFPIHPVACSIASFVTFLLRNGSGAIPEDLLVSLNDLHERASEIGYFNALVEQPSFEASGVLNWWKEKYAGPARAIYAASVQLPAHVIYVIVRRTCSMQDEDAGRTRFIFGQTDYARVRIVVGTVETTADLIHREMTVRSKQMDEVPTIVLPPDLTREIRKM